jgi:hypothetical protein
MEGAFPAPPPVPCCECGQPAIGMCPSCKKRVHQDYGYNGANCSGRHEGKCEGARMSRERGPKGFGPPAEVRVYTAPMPLKAKCHKNGVHKKSVAKKGRR